MRHYLAAACAIAACCLGAHPASAEDKDTRLAKGVQDNSFLIEEAYNQEAGVVQHIASLRRQGRDWTLNYTDEWPVRSQTHQFSYTVPYLWLNGAGVHTQGFGDVMLNYRYQALTETGTLPAFAPRVSLILPTGDRDKDTGNDSVGYQIGLPFSKIVSNRVTLHANAGVTSYADVAGRQPTSYSLGGSAIYAVTRDTNLMLETLSEWNESVNTTGGIDREFTLTVLPGIRHAFNLPDDAQLVVGAGAPISFTGSHTDYGVFLYLSFEHKFRR